MHSAVIFCIILTSLTKYNFGLEYNKQQRYYNQNTDFLLHESGISSNGPSKNGQAVTATTSTLQNVNQNNAKRDYVAQFPSLSPANTQKSSTAGTFTNVNSQNSGKRDYVAPQFPQLPTQTTSKPTIGTASTRNPTNNNGAKRDYVAPHYSTPNPGQGNNQPPTNTKVEDLINFYDNKNTDQNGPQNIPSYSSILQGSTNKNTPSTSTTAQWTQSTSRPVTPNKPLSFSNVVSGSKSPNYPNSPTRGPATPTVRPGAPVLPSSIVNNNKNSQGNSNEPTDAELQTLSEELLRKDVNNAAKLITVNYQEKTTSHSNEDKAPGPLLTVNPEVWSIPTIQSFVPLLDNYERDTLVNEYVTPQERNEENAFMDAIMSTTVIRHLMTFFKNKGIVSPDPKQQRDFLKQLWFSLYSRGKGKISSSGFEHIFVSELKNGQVSGLHNWIYFSKEEAANRINYLGYLKYAELGDKGAVLKLHFNQLGVDKPVDTMFVGTSPELEIALYTLCFVTRVDTECKLKLANKDIEIVTHKFRYRSKDLIGSAYPQIPFNAY